jgi:hypothetical protein
MCVFSARKGIKQREVYLLLMTVLIGMLVIREAQKHKALGPSFCNSRTIFE